MVCLSGDLGAGKTTFAAGIGEGWGADYPLTSPTFVVVRRYERPTDRARLYHLDAYRLTSEGDADSIGLDDILDGSSAVVIEWAEHLHAALPQDCLWLRMRDDAANEQSRYLYVEAYGTRSFQLMDAFRQKVEGDAASN